MRYGRPEMFGLVFMSLLISLLIAALLGGNMVWFVVAFVLSFSVIGVVGLYRDWFV